MRPVRRLGQIRFIFNAKILVCHTGAWIGDMVLLTPALRDLKQAYPESCLTVLLRPLVANLMTTNPYVDNYIVDTKQEGLYRSFIRLVRQIRDNAFDIAIVLHPTSFRNALLPYLARIPIRIGSNYKGRGFFLTSSCSNNTNLHEVDRYLSVLHLLNINTVTIENSVDITSSLSSTYLEFWHTDADRQMIQQVLQNEGVSPNERLIVVNLGTTWRTKQWDARNFDEVINQISNAAPDVKIVLTGSSSEEKIVKKLSLTESTLNLVGKTDILQLGALLERCEVCLTCDSGPMHIAAAVGTPTIALFGPTDPIRHQPYGIGHTVIEKPVSCRPCYKRTCHRQDTPHLCMQKINTTDVIKALVTKLNLKNPTILHKILEEV
jgi:heptosyltransferase-2/heptosyltransferase-3